MSKMQTVKGVLQTFWRMAKEDFVMMDHKLMRMAIGVITFLVMAFIWFFVFRSINPLKF